MDDDAKGCTSLPTPVPEPPAKATQGSSAPIVSRREFIERGTSAVGGTLLGGTLAAALACLPGCGGGASEGGFQSQEYLTRLFEDRQEYYDLVGGQRLGDCPSLSQQATYQSGDDLRCTMIFEIPDQGAFQESGNQPPALPPGAPPPTSPVATPPPDTTPPNNPSRAFEYQKQFPGFFVFAGRVDTHPLKPCVDMDVLHTHLTIKRDASTPDSEAWAKFHLGVYRDGANKCFVLYDNINKAICVNACYPTDPPLGDVQHMIGDSLKAGFSAQGVSTLPWVIAGAAFVIARALLPVLLVIAA